MYERISPRPIMHEFERAWAEFDPSDPCRVLDADRVVLERSEFAPYIARYDSWDSFLKHPDSQMKKTHLHLSLLPHPFFGTLSNASVFILTLNPKVGPSDYRAEDNLEYQTAWANTLRQAGEPFMWLNPRFSWHGGFEYWHRDRCTTLVDRCSREFRIPRTHALAFMAKSVAVIQLVPYHSVSAPPDRMIDQLESVNLARRFVKEVVVPRALAGEALIVAVRGVTRWNLPSGPNIVLYSQGQSRGAYLTPAHEAIFRRLGRTWNDMVDGYRLQRGR
jgi:hypothetical protein